MEPSKKCTFVPKMIYFTKQAKNLKNGNQLDSIYDVNIKEPKTQGTTWNHPKCTFVPKMIYFTKQAKNLKMGTS